MDNRNKYINNLQSYVIFDFNIVCVGFSFSDVLPSSVTEATKSFNYVVNKAEDVMKKVNNSLKNNICKRFMKFIPLIFFIIYHSKFFSGF